jgi:hypothetical protein
MIGDKQNLNPKIVTPSQNNTIKLNVKKNALKLNVMETKKKLSSSKSKSVETT